MPIGIYKRTKEHNKNISLALKGKKFSEEHCKNISIARKGKKHSEETKEKIRISVGERWSNFEERKKQSKARKKYLANPKNRKKLSKATKQQWKDGIYDGVFTSPTKPEKNIIQVLENLKLDYIFQFRPNGYSKPYDFYIPKMNLLIEYDSEYWHNLPKMKERDKKKTNWAKNNKYNLLRINEKNIDNFYNILNNKH